MTAYCGLCIVCAGLRDRKKITSLIGDSREGKWCNSIADKRHGKQCSKLPSFHPRFFRQWRISFGSGEQRQSIQFAFSLLECIERQLQTYATDRLPRSC